jgi:hypothetical protein
LGYLTRKDNRKGFYRIEFGMLEPLSGWSAFKSLPQNALMPIFINFRDRQPKFSVMQVI